MCELNSVPVSSATCSSVCVFSKSVNSNGCKVLKNNFNAIPLNAKMLSKASNSSSWNGRITILSKSTELFCNSSAFELNPFVEATPNNKGDVTLCPNIILRKHSSLK